MKEVKVKEEDEVIKILSIMKDDLQEEDNKKSTEQLERIELIEKYIRSNTDNKDIN